LKKKVYDGCNFLCAIYIQKEKEKEKEGRNIELMEESGGKEETLPPGFRFHPTDEELITCYLINKISDSSFTGKAITDINLNKSEPWELPGIYTTLYD
jgi:hypothetical protein